VSTDKNAEITLVTGVIGEDVHNVGLKIIEHALRKVGYNIVSLGVQVPQEEFVSAAQESAADAILISSLAGHAHVDCEGFRDKLSEAGLGNIRMYIGGQLTVVEEPWEDTEKAFKDIGFNRVYPKSVGIAQIIQDLDADLK
jgi:methylaspartate mutase sigma subunit